MPYTLTDLSEDLTAVLNYAQPDEERDFEENQGDEHIVHAMRRLRAWTAPDRAEP